MFVPGPILWGATMVKGFQNRSRLTLQKRVRPQRRKEIFQTKVISKVQKDIKSEGNTLKNGYI